MQELSSAFAPSHRLLHSENPSNCMMASCAKLSTIASPVAALGHTGARSAQPKSVQSVRTVASPLRKSARRGPVAKTQCAIRALGQEVGANAVSGALKQLVANL